MKKFKFSIAKKINTSKKVRHKQSGFAATEKDRCEGTQSSTNADRNAAKVAENTAQPKETDVQPPFDDDSVNDKTALLKVLLYTPDCYIKFIV